MKSIWRIPYRGKRLIPELIPARSRLVFKLFMALLLCHGKAVQPSATHSSSDEHIVKSTLSQFTEII